MIELTASSGNCAFCNIANGEDRETEVVCKSDNWLAFFPLNPATPGHTLVIPRKHVPDLWQAEPELGGELTSAVIRLGQAIKLALRPEGMNLITSAGQTAEQSIFHLHLHIVPRWQRDGFGRIWPVDGKYDDAELEDVAGSIRAACREIGLSY
jgi:histidine triad (HIT) family protein